MYAANYIEDRNPFSVAPPPKWWLRDIYNFDPDIVVMPSCIRLGVFWLTRRKRFTIGLTDQAIAKEVAHERTDTAMFVRHRVEPITDIVSPMGVWSSQRVLQWLADRDTWAVEGGPLDAEGIIKAWAEGGSKYTKLVEAQEAEAEAKRKRDQRETIWHATGDGWRSVQARKGQRILNAGMPKTSPPQPASESKQLIITGV